MPPRTTLMFWAALVIAVVLLGGAISTVRHGVGAADDVAVLTLSIAGFVAAITIVGRVLLVVGRATRRSP